MPRAKRPTTPIGQASRGCTASRARPQRPWPWWLCGPSTAAAASSPLARATNGKEPIDEKMRLFLVEEWHDGPRDAPRSAADPQRDRGKEVERQREASAGEQRPFGKQQVEPDAVQPASTVERRVDVGPERLRSRMNRWRPSRAAGVEDRDLEPH